MANLSAYGNMQDDRPIKPMGNLNNSNAYATANERPIRPMQNNKSYGNVVDDEYDYHDNDEYENSGDGVSKRQKTVVEKKEDKVLNEKTKELQKLRNKRSKYDPRKALKEAK